MTPYVFYAPSGEILGCYRGPEADAKVQLDLYPKGTKHLEGDIHGHQGDWRVERGKLVQRPRTLGYAEQRRMAYPPLTEQFDALWKGGEAAEAMRLQVAAVKAQYPKT